MSYSQGSGSSNTTSGQYENNVRFDSDTQKLLSTLTGQVQSGLENKEGNALSTASSNTLKSALTGDWSGDVNPYTKGLADAYQAQNYANFQKDFAKAYSGVQGYGQGTSNAGLANAYSNYKLSNDAQIAKLLNDQYNTDYNAALSAANTGIGQDTISKLSSTVLGLGDLLKETYGYTPVTTSTENRTGYGIKN